MAAVISLSRAPATGKSLPSLSFHRGCCVPSEGQDYSPPGELEASRQRELLQIHI